MEEIINRYKDINGYINDSEKLYNELKANKYSLTDIINVMKNIKITNEEIIRNLDKDNKKREKLINEKNNIVINNYVKEEKVTINKKDSNKNNRDINISFYIDYINNYLENDLFLNILPKNNTKDSINIIDNILVYVLKEISFYEYNLVYDNDAYSIKYITDEIIKYKYIYKKILDYKINLNKVNDGTLNNELTYFMDNKIPNVFKDVNDLETMKSIIKLLKSIEDGIFLNIKAFTNNDKLKGIFEVRDLNKRNRVIFEFIGNGKCSIICSLINKTDSNSKYKDNLYNQIRKYKDNINNLSKYDIKRLVLGE